MRLCWRWASPSESLKRGMPSQGRAEGPPPRRPARPCHTCRSGAAAGAGLGELVRGRWAGAGAGRGRRWGRGRAQRLEPPPDVGNLPRAGAGRGGRRERPAGQAEPAGGARRPACHRAEGRSR